MTVRYIKIFLEVYQQCSITRAAEALHMTQPAVTRAIQELESYYGVRLFERMNRRLLVTEAGRALYGQALHWVGLFEQMEQSLRNWDALGVLRVGSSVTIGNFLLPDLILRFREHHPGLKPRVTVCNGGDLQQALLDNQLDLALIEGEVQHPDLVAQPFSTDRLALILPPGHELVKASEIHLEDLVNCDLLMRERGSAGRSYLDSVFAVHGLKIEPVWESISTQALIRAVSKGLGVALLPRMLVRADAERGTVCVRDIAGEPLVRRNVIAWHKNKYLTSAAQDFIALCMEKEG